MKRTGLAVWLMALAGAAAAQRGSVSGIVSDPHGVVAAAPIQVRNKATGAVARTSSGSDGSYSFLKLEAGTYELSIVMPCCAYNRFGKEVVVEASGLGSKLEVMLTETINGTTLGDDPGRVAAMMKERARVPSKPAPRTAWGKPDLSGVWLEKEDPYPETLELLPWAAAVSKEWNDNLRKDAPHNRCLPERLPLPGASTPFIGKFVQTPELVVLLFEDVPGFRQIFMDGRKHPGDFDPSWMGHSVGKWEGDTLVVDTIGFNEQSWVGGNFPHSEMMRMTERYRRADLGHLEVKVTFDDPKAMVKPLHVNMTWDLAQGEDLLEFVCENNKPQHLLGK